MSDVLGDFVLFAPLHAPRKGVWAKRIVCYHPYHWSLYDFPWNLHVCTIALAGLALACWSFAETHFLLKTLQNLEAGADVKEDLKNWAKQQEAELAEERSVSFSMSQGDNDVSGDCSYKMPWLCLPLLHVPVDVFRCTYIYIHINWGLLKMQWDTALWIFHVRVVYMYALYIILWTQTEVYEMHTAFTISEVYTSTSIYPCFCFPPSLAKALWGTWCKNSILCTGGLP